MLNKAKKRLFLITGFASFGIGLVGLYLPLLPTTPFVLLSAWLFAKSSDKYHHWVRNNRYFGETVRAWEAKRGLTVREKWRIVTSVALFVGISFIVCPNFIGRIVLTLVLIIHIVVLIFIKTRKENKNIKLIDTNKKESKQ